MNIVDANLRKLFTHLTFQKKIKHNLNTRTVTSCSYCAFGSSAAAAAMAAAALYVFVLPRFAVRGDGTGVAGGSIAPPIFVH